jgi:hypothetical protein|uniref:hypothetical protein n=1 Tax=Roseivirga sp. TaxID=1964215 RepID=UPI004048A378
MKNLKAKITTVVFLLFALVAFSWNAKGASEFVITCPDGDRYVCYKFTSGTPEDPEAYTYVFRKGKGETTVVIK